MMSRHFVWLTPLSNLLFFAVLGVFLAVAAKLWPRSWRWIGPRLIVFLAILPVLIVLSPADLRGGLGDPVAAGAAVRLAPFLERHCDRVAPAVAADVSRAWWAWSWSWPAGTSAASGSPSGARPPALPSGDPPNVLLITLDTVRADHLSLYGYERPTSPVLERLARSGVRFDEARAAAPWTLPSHASLFTGRWPHELGVNWNDPLDGEYPTLAGYLGSRGYATAGFVANTIECSYDNGLDRGFAHYEDYILEYLLPFRTAWLFDHAVRASDRRWACTWAARSTSARYAPSTSRGSRPTTLQWRRKDAGSINRAFLDWLSRRPRAQPPVLRLPQLLRCSRTLRAPRRGRLPLRAEAPEGGAISSSSRSSGNRSTRLAFRPVYRELARTPTTTAWLTWTSGWANCSASSSAAAYSITRGSS